MGTDGQNQRVPITDNISLDFSGLFEKEQPPESPKEPLSDKEGNNIPIEEENHLKRQIEGLEGQQSKQLYLQAQKEKEDHERSLAVYKEYQNNIKESSLLQAEILKGAEAGEDVYTLFLKAAKAIGLMTSNTVFYNQLETDIKAIYGRGLQEKPLLQTELQEAEERLQRLKKAMGRDESPDDKERIRKALEKNEAQVTELRKMIEEA